MNIYIICQWQTLELMLHCKRSGVNYLFNELDFTMYRTTTQGILTRQSFGKTLPTLWMLERIYPGSRALAKTKMTYRRVMTSKSDDIAKTFFACEALLRYLIRKETMHSFFGPDIRYSRKRTEGWHDQLRQAGTFWRGLCQVGVFFANLGCKVCPDPRICNLQSLTVHVPHQSLGTSDCLNFNSFN